MVANLRMTLFDVVNKLQQGAGPNLLRDGVQLLGKADSGTSLTDFQTHRPRSICKAMNL